MPVEFILLYLLGMKVIEWGTMVALQDADQRYGVYVYDDGEHQDFSMYSCTKIESEDPECAQGIREVAAMMRRALPTAFHLADLTERQYLAITSLLHEAMMEGRRVTEQELWQILSRPS